MLYIPVLVMLGMSEEKVTPNYLTWPRINASKNDNISWRCSRSCVSYKSLVLTHRSSTPCCCNLCSLTTFVSFLTNFIRCVRLSNTTPTVACDDGPAIEVFVSALSAVEGPSSSKISAVSENSFSEHSSGPRTPIL